MTPVDIRHEGVRKVALSISPVDLALTHELIQFAIEQLSHTIQVGSGVGHRPIIAEIERYRSQAVELLERLGEK